MVALLPVGQQKEKTEECTIEGPEFSVEEESVTDDAGGESRL